MARWKFTDSSTGTPVVFEFPINPNKFQPPARKSRVTADYGTGGNGSRIMFQGQDEVSRGSFGGVINTQTQHDNMVFWSGKWYPLTLEDDLGNTWDILIVSYSEDRLNRHIYPHRYDYNIEFMLI